MCRVQHMLSSAAWTAAVYWWRDRLAVYLVFWFIVASGAGETAATRRDVCLQVLPAGCSNLCVRQCAYCKLTFLSGLIGVVNQAATRYDPAYITTADRLHVQSMAPARNSCSPPTTVKRMNRGSGGQSSMACSKRAAGSKRSRIFCSCALMFEAFWAWKRAGECVAGWSFFGLVCYKDKASEAGSTAGNNQGNRTPTQSATRSTYQHTHAIAHSSTCPGRSQTHTGPHTPHPQSPPHAHPHSHPVPQPGPRTPKAHAAQAAKPKTQRQL